MAANDSGVTRPASPAAAIRFGRRSDMRAVVKRRPTLSSTSVVAIGRRRRRPREAGAPEKRRTIATDAVRRRP